MRNDVFATTPRLTWRRGRVEDIDALHAVVSDFEVIRQTETWPWPPERAFTEARCCVEPSGNAVSGVVTCDDGIIGYLGLSPEGKLGYMFGVEHWGQGYATEIGRAAVDFAFSTLELHRLEACVFDDNTASSRVLEKLGFEEGPRCKGPCAARGGVFPIRTFTCSRA